MKVDDKAKSIDAESTAGGDEKCVAEVISGITGDMKCDSEEMRNPQESKGSIDSDDSSQLRGDDLVPSISRSNQEKEEHLEVKYEKATQLFRDIEECSWKDAFLCVQEEIEEKNPKQSRTWVYSEKDEGMTFCWSVWRRLPLHECCRRQPPAELVNALLFCYPEAVMSRTNFGELPLHLACGCGAPDFIVDMLIAAYPGGVLCKDNAGRTPMQLVPENLRPHQRGILRSLESCEQFLEEESRKQEIQLLNTQAEHSREAAQMKRASAEEKGEMLSEVAAVQTQLKESRKKCDGLESELEDLEGEVREKAKAEAYWKDSTKDAKVVVAKYKDENKELYGQISTLSATIQSKDETIESLNRKIEHLVATVQSLSKEQDDVLCMMKQRDEYLKSAELEQAKILATVEGQKETLNSILEG